MSSTNVTIPAEEIVIAVAADATPIVPPSLIRMSSLNVTIPAEEIWIASVALAEPTSPSSGTIMLPANVATVELTVSLAVPPVVIATWSAAEKKIPVLASPVFVIDGAPAEPSAKDVTPVIVGLASETTEDVALIPLVNAVPVPKRVYISTKLSLTLSPPTLRVSPVPSLAAVPISIDWYAILLPFYYL